MNRNHQKADHRENGRHAGCILTGRSTAAVLALVFCLISWTWAAAETFEPVSAAVTGIDQFGDAVLDLEEISLEYGDSVDVSLTSISTSAPSAAKNAGRMIE